MAIPPTGRFRSDDRVLRAAEYQRVRKLGSHLHSRRFVASFASASNGPESRKSGLSHGKSRKLGLVVSRRVGNSVTRNHVKRRIREWFRIWRDHLDEGSLVLVARPSAASATGREISDELCKLFKINTLSS